MNQQPFSKPLPWVTLGQIGCTIAYKKSICSFLFINRHIHLYAVSVQDGRYRGVLQLPIMCGSYLVFNFQYHFKNLLCQAFTSFLGSLRIVPFCPFRFQCIHVSVIFSKQSFRSMCTRNFNYHVLILNKSEFYVSIFCKAFSFCACSVNAMLSIVE